MTAVGGHYLGKVLPMVKIGRWWFTRPNVAGHILFELPLKPGQGQGIPLTALLRKRGGMMIVHKTKDLAIRDGFGVKNTHASGLSLIRVDDLIRAAVGTGQLIRRDVVDTTGRGEVCGVEMQLVQWSGDVWVVTNLAGHLIAGLPQRHGGGGTTLRSLLNSRGLVSELTVVCRERAVLDALRMKNRNVSLIRVADVPTALEAVGKLPK